MTDHNDVTTSAEFGTSPKTLGLYIIGFVLCIILTLIPFALVAIHKLDTDILFISLAACAILQLLVQVTCFLRLNLSASGLWNSMSFVLTLLIVAVIAGGSLWIMFNLNYYMVN